MIPALENRGRKILHSRPSQIQPKTKVNQIQPFFSWFLVVAPQENLPHVLRMDHMDLWGNHAKSTLLALVHRWETHTLVEHICLMP